MTTATRIPDVPELPQWCKTKADGEAVVDLLFPPLDRFRAEIRQRYPHELEDAQRYHADRIAQDRLIAFFRWLRNSKVKIYKTAMWHLSYRTAARYNAFLIENTEHRKWVCQAQHGERYTERWENQRHENGTGI